jgi:hypothetical protein
MAKDSRPIEVRLSEALRPQPQVQSLRARMLGEADRLVARAVDSFVRHPFEDSYLCPACGQDGVVDKCRLAPGGIVDCSACGGTMQQQGRA